MIANFFYGDAFFESINQFAEYLEIHPSNIQEISNNNHGDKIEVEKAELKPIYFITAHLMYKLLRDKFDVSAPTNSQDNYDDYENKIIEVLEKNINFDKLNKELPQVFKKTGESLFISLNI